MIEEDIQELKNSMARVERLLATTTPIEALVSTPGVRPLLLERMEMVLQLNHISAYIRDDWGEEFIVFPNQGAVPKEFSRQVSDALAVFIGLGVKIRIEVRPR